MPVLPPFVPSRLPLKVRRFARLRVVKLLHSRHCAFRHKTSVLFSLQGVDDSGMHRPLTPLLPWKTTWFDYHLMVSSHPRSFTEGSTAVTAAGPSSKVTNGQSCDCLLDRFRPEFPRITTIYLFERTRQPRQRAFRRQGGS